MENRRNRVTNHSWCIRAESFRSSHVLVKSISAARWVDRATKNSVNTRDREDKNVTNRKESLPNHTETTVARSLTEEPDGYNVKLLSHKGTKLRDFCLTLLIVGDPDSELFSRLQTRIETRSIAIIQIHTRVFEGTLRHGMRD